MLSLPLQLSACWRAGWLENGDLVSLQQSWHTGHRLKFCMKNLFRQSSHVPCAHKWFELCWELFFSRGFLLSLACNALQSRYLFLIRGQIEQAKCSYFYYPQEGMVTVLHSSQQNKSFLLFWPLFAAPAPKRLGNLLDNDLLETEVALKLDSTSLGFSSKCFNKDYFNPRYKNNCIIIIIYRELFVVYTQWYIHEDIGYACI